VTKTGQVDKGCILKKFIKKLTLYLRKNALSGWKYYGLTKAAVFIRLLLGCNGNGFE